MIKKEDCIKIGEVGKAHNLQGAVVVYSDNDLLEQYREEPVFILLEGAPVPFFIAKDGLMTRNHSSYIVKFDYVDSKAQADRLAGRDLLMDKDLVGEEEEDLPFELSELIGFSVLDILTQESGEVVDVANYSGNMLLSVRIFSKEILLPLSERYVKEILENEQLLRVEIPEEIKELY
ncbi:ribosome maturation factor RimM [uncultured Sanguibacteroides sp.]|uniref:ribosome maturation factor RimM n=1 Tax=uncultured Sanguibacteroides sp. TaxID=1635151 RepID=UPI0025CBC593|nr:ribosome maturation factor RimM [uncultured Sanguibacteroides sp.]